MVVVHSHLHDTQTEPKGATDALRMHSRSRRRNGRDMVTLTTMRAA